MRLAAAIDRRVSTSRRRQGMRRTIRATAAGLGLLLAARASAEAQAGAAAEPLTLEDAVKLALEHNRSVARAALQVDRAEQNVGAAKARRFPNLDLQAIAGSTLNTIKVTYPAGAFGSYPVIGPIPSTDTVVESPPTVSGNVSATLAQPLTQLYKIGLNTKLNELGRDA